MGCTSDNMILQSERSFINYGELIQMRDAFYRVNDEIKQIKQMQKYFGYSRDLSITLEILHLIAECIYYVIIIIDLEDRSVIARSRRPRKVSHGNGNASLHQRDPASVHHGLRVS